MASFNITVKTFRSTGFVDLGSITLVRLQAIDVAARPPSIIQPVGVIRSRQTAYTGAEKVFTVRDVASDIIPDRKLLMTNVYRTTGSISATFPNVPGTLPETVEIGNFVTDAGVMYGITCDGLTAKQIDVECKKDLTATEDVTIIQRVYKYNADGSLELLAENESGFITTAYAPYSFTPSIAARWGASGDRLMVKYLGVNYGIPV